MQVVKSTLEGVLLIEPRAFPDNRGFFMESYNRRKLAEHGFDLEFVQDNHSASVQGTLRGLHYQIQPGQDKLVRCTVGRVFDVVVDIRRGSPTFGQWEGFVLSAENKRQVLVPKGFAHGFCVLSEYAEFLYKCTEYWSPKDERSIRWDDPAIGVAWPIKDVIMSEKDLRSPMFTDADLWFEYGRNC